MAQNVGLGHKAYLGIGEETTWGTERARGKFVEINDEGMSVTEEILTSPSLFRVGIHKDRKLRGNIAVAGPITFNPQFGGNEKLWRAAFGNDFTTSTPDPTNAATVRQHVFRLADQLDPGLTLEIDKDIQTFLAVGSKIDTIEWSFRSGELVVCTLGIVSKDIITGTATSGKTFSATPLAHGGITTLTWGGTALDCSEATITLNNGLGADRRFIGSRFVSEPVRENKRTVTGSFTTEFQSVSQYNDFRNSTERALKILVEGAAIQSTQLYTMQFDVAVGLLERAFPLANTQGRLMVEIPFVTYQNDANKEMTLTVKNTTTAV